MGQILKRPPNELVMIAAAGGGFAISARDHTVNDLTMIAAAAGRHHARLVILDAFSTPSNDLTMIAAAGKGAVSFE